MTDYDKYPGHRLYGVPQEVLDAASKELELLVEYGDLAAEDVQPVADTVLASAMPAIRKWLSSSEAPDLAQVIYNTLDSDPHWDADTFKELERVFLRAGYRPLDRTPLNKLVKLNSDNEWESKKDE